eukprot:12404835-Ditylum_brightwellii.AAC.1
MRHLHIWLWTIGGCFGNKLQNTGKKTGEAEMNEQLSNAYAGDEDDQREVRALPGEDKETGVKGKWSRDNKT